MVRGTTFGIYFCNRFNLKLPRSHYFIKKLSVKVRRNLKISDFWVLYIFYGRYV